VKHLSLLHYVSLDGAGGVELQFVEFLHAAQRIARAEHAVVACGRDVHRLVRERLESARVPVAREKYASGMKLPKWPTTLRSARQRMLMQRHQADAVVIWNRLRDSLNTLAAAGPERCVYWERGASWFAGETRAKHEFLSHIQAIVCNSHAARRMLELRWGYTGQIQVVPNALRPSLLPRNPQPRQLRRDAVLHLGVVARLSPIKGVALAMQAFALLREQGMDVVLHIAGDGPERARLESLAQRLGIARHVIFEGLIADMGAFYERIGILVHPALREPFGQIAVEANAYGVPAIVAAVDGLVEVVAHDDTGLCVAPTLDLSDYEAIGGSRDDLPPFVYDPVRDAIAPPRLVDPTHLADNVRSLVNDPTRYARMSTRAIEAVGERFVFDDHVRSALDAINAFVQYGQLKSDARSHTHDGQR